MILSKDGYALQYEPRKNRIIITMPQTVYTLTDTVNPVVDRRTDVPEENLAVLLAVARMLFQKETKNEPTD